MVSLARAAECVGRRIKHTAPIELTGVVHHVTDLDVWVQEADGSVTPCVPENMEWVRSLTPELRAAITGGWYYENVQVFFTPDLYFTEADEALDYHDEIQGLGVVGSGAQSNDDGQNHPLYVIAYGIHRVYRARINAAPEGVWEIEELLGWAQS